MNWGARAAALTAALGLAACATVTPDIPLAGDSLSGRIAVKVEASASAPARSETAGFELQGSARNGRMKLSTPLGSVLAEARWSPGSVVLATPRGERHFDDLDALTREVLGESVPVAALFDWLRGRPWNGAPSAPSTPLAETGFSQLGWTVGLARVDEGIIVAQRTAPPPVTVRVKIDR